MTISYRITLFRSIQMDCLAVTSAFLLLPFLSLPAGAQSLISPQVTQGSTGKTYTISVPNYNNISPENADQMTDSIESQQEAIKANLLNQLTQNHLSDDAKANVIRLVGELRIYKAADVLIQNIDFFHNRSSINGVPITNTAIQAGGGFVSRDALVELGSTSFYALIDVIGSRNNAVPFDQARVNGYCWVLNALRGPTFTTQQLKQQLAAEKDPKVQAQYRSVLDRIKAYAPD